MYIWFHVASRDKELFKVVSSAVGSFDFSVRLFHWFCSEIVWRKGDPNREFICLLGIFSEETFWISHCWRVFFFLHYIFPCTSCYNIHFNCCGFFLLSAKRFHCDVIRLSSEYVIPISIWIFTRSNIYNKYGPYSGWNIIHLENSAVNVRP